MDNKFTVFDTPLESKEYKDLKKEWDSIKSYKTDIPEFEINIPSVSYYPDPFKNKPKQNNISNPEVIDNYFDASYYEKSEINYAIPNINFEQSSNYTGNNYYIQYFMNKGLTEAQARGIYGNLMQESAGKINARSSDGYGSYGLAQWTGERKTRLFKMYGKNPTRDEQLDFLWWELNNTHKSALEDLKKTTSVYDATLSFMNKFEKPSKKYANFDNRLRYAQS